VREKEEGMEGEDDSILLMRRSEGKIGKNKGGDEGRKVVIKKTLLLFFIEFFVDILEDTYLPNHCFSGNLASIKSPKRLSKR
jgi:hypothetical protein